MLQAQAMGNEEACRKRKTTGVEFGGGDSGISPFFHGIKMFSMDKSLREKKREPALSGNYHWLDSVL